ncbi:MAG TPA: response regulator [Campylobacterales bacterium]|nr:response regulator [Campylobacterales bacterium]HHD81220.1 response regulator [Campylobacterales bacterium]
MKLNNYTILYVEDDIDTQELMSNILKMTFGDVFVANNGEEGLELYKEKKPDIVLSDISMPVMDGLEMSELIKEINPQQLIALFTAFSDPEYQKKAAQLEIDTYIMKPLDEKQFFNSLNYLGMILHTQKQA